MRLLQHFFVLSFIMSCALPGCIAHKQARKMRIIESADANNIAEYEARLIDLPIPLSSKSIPESSLISDAQAALLTHESTDSMQDLYAFYSHEMEWLGWQKEHEALFENHEIIMYFSKPQKKCFVTLRSQENSKTTIVVTYKIV